MEKFLFEKYEEKLGTCTSCQDWRERWERSFRKVYAKHAKDRVVIKKGRFKIFSKINLMDPEEPLLRDPEPPKHQWLRWVPIVGLIVSMYSAIFATAVLFPWHQQLSDEFQKMKSQCIKE